MKSLLNAALLTSALLLGACVTAPPKPISLDQNATSLKGAKVGVAMSAVPKPDTQFPGAACLFCLAAANIANLSLTSHTQTLPLEDLPKLKAELAGLLRDKGATVVELPDSFVVASLPDSSGKSENTARKDFSSLRSKYNIDKLVVLDITLLGMVRTYLLGLLPHQRSQSLVKRSGLYGQLRQQSVRVVRACQHQQRH